MPYSDPQTRKEYQKLWYLKYKTQHNRLGAKWYLKHKIQCNIYSRRQYLRDPVSWYRNTRRWALEHPERNRELKRNWARKDRLRKKIFNTLNGVKIHGQKEKKVR